MTHLNTAPDAGAALRGRTSKGLRAISRTPSRVSTEMSLHVLAYNLKRLTRILAAQEVDSPFHSQWFGRSTKTFVSSFRSSFIASCVPIQNCLNVPRPAILALQPTSAPGRSEIEWLAISVSCGIFAGISQPRSTWLLRPMMRLYHSPRCTRWEPSAAWLPA
jgi:hypothetical protein